LYFDIDDAIESESDDWGGELEEVVVIKWNIKRSGHLQDQATSHECPNAPTFWAMNKLQP
jgi:hypothetical protein